MKHLYITLAGMLTALCARRKTRRSPIETCCALFFVILNSLPIASQSRVTDLSELKVGSVIKIYPKGCYGESEKALSCSGNGNNLTFSDSEGDSWTIVDAGGNCYYLQNEFGCYWTSKSAQPYNSFLCSTDKKNAAKISFYWNSYYEGVCIFNELNEKGLKIDGGYCRWTSSSSDYVLDINAAFDVAIVEDGDGGSVKCSKKCINVNGVNYLLDLRSKMASVIPLKEKSYSGNLIIPPSVDYDNACYIVTSLADRCFKGCGGLTSIQIPQSVKSLGYYCFEECSALTNIVLPDGMSTLNVGCFEGCHSLESINIPEDVTSIGGSCFMGCSRLRSVHVPEKITSIGGMSFSGCSSLESIDLPTCITSLGYKCFEGCNSLASISIPCGVTTWNQEWFTGCTSLKKITLSNGITHLDAGSFAGMSNLTEITLPQSLTSLPVNCFSGCSSLKNIKIPDSVTSLAGGCFQGCSSLENIDIPLNVTILGSDCFRGCSSLKIIKLPDSILSLGSECFLGCSSLKSIILPNSVASIGKRCFQNCSGLEDISFSNSIVSLPYMAFMGCSSLTSITFPDSVTALDGFCFSSCPFLYEIRIKQKEKVVSCYGNSFYGVDKNTCVLFVPANLLQEYREADAWKDFLNIKALPDEFDSNSEVVAESEIRIFLGNRHLSVKGLADGEVIQVSNTSGITVYKGIEHEVDLEAAGIYIINVKGQTLKSCVR